MSLKYGFLLNGFFVIANFVTKIKAGLLKVRVFMPEMLLDEILGNQMGKNAIFHNKKGSFLQNNRVCSLCMEY